MKPNHKKTLNYLVYKLAFSYQQAHSIMRQYAAHVGIERPIHPNSSWYNPVGDAIQKDWDGFMEFYGTIKGNYPAFSSRKKNRNNDTIRFETPYQGRH